MTSGMRITWTLGAHGWADCTLEDHRSTAELAASSITSAPEEFLTAVARLVAGETETRAQFEAEAGRLPVDLPSRRRGHLDPRARIERRQRS